MKVYVVDFVDVENDEDFITGVFDSREGAENHIMKEIEKEFGGCELDISKSEHCITVNDEDGEVYGKYYICEHELNKA